MPEDNKEKVGAPINPNIDVDRLKRDLGITEADYALIEGLNIPDTILVPSTSAIKTGTVGDALRIVCPNREFNVIGVAGVSSSKVDASEDEIVGEQPFGRKTIRGALNRMEGAVAARGVLAPQERDDDRACISIENGLFRESGHATEPQVFDEEGVVANTEGVDLHDQFDENAEHDDRTVIAIKLPGHSPVVQISPDAEAVRFPKDAIIAARDDEGGFLKHTAGSKLKELGLVRDKQNPHKELTADRPEGPMPREDQMARAIIRDLLTQARATPQTNG